MHIPYTYLIGWSSLDLWYYGVRTKINCHPGDLWVKYFTSSKRVKELRSLHGEPDIIKIRRTFETAEKAKNWEIKVLRRLKVRGKINWINLTYPNAFGFKEVWNKGLTKENNEKMKEISLKISKASFGRVSSLTGYKHTQEVVEANRWRQIIRRQPEFPFKSYRDFKEDVLKKHKETRLGPYALANFYNVDGSAIQSIIGSETNMGWTKIIKNNPDFPFKNYEDFKKEVLKRYEETKLGPGNLAKFYKVNYSTIKRIIGDVTDKNSVAWTRIRGRLPDFPFETYEDFSKYCYDQKLSGRKVYKIAQELKIAQGTVNTAIIRWQEANSC